MKLRIRNLKTKETIKVEITDSSSLHDLKALISSKLSSSVSPQFINLSLNRNDPLISSTPNDSLKSLGLTSGDLLFCEEVLNVSPISYPVRNEALNKEPYKERSCFEAGNTSNSASVEYSVDKFKIQARDSEIPNTLLTEKVEFETDDMSKSNADANPIENTDVQGENSQNPNLDETLIDADAETCYMEMQKSSSSVPYILKRVINMEKEEIQGNTGYIVAAIHAVFLESGFEISNGTGNRLPNNWNSRTSVFSLQYTVPELQNISNPKLANLRFSISKNHVIVYGNLRDEFNVYRLDLDVSKVLPLLLFLLDTLTTEEEKEIFKFWRTTKDSLCLPLLIDVCHSNGLPSPPCFARLPTDLKHLILELLPGADIAKTACTSSEMRYLCLDEDLWKKKFHEEFRRGRDNAGVNKGTWRELFKFMWVRSKCHGQRYPRTYPPYQMYMPRYPPIFGPQAFPFVGGDYDRFPAIHGFGSMGPVLGQPRPALRRIFSPRCNLGARDNLH